MILNELQLKDIDLFYDKMVVSQASPAQVVGANLTVITDCLYEMLVVLGPDATIPYIKKLVDELIERQNEWEVLFDAFRAKVALMGDLNKLKTFGGAHGH